MSVIRRISTVALILFGMGCATTAPNPEPVRFSADELLSGSAIGMSRTVALPTEDDVLGVSEPMRAFLKAHVHPTATAQVKLRQLLDALIDSGSFEIEYETVTRTASETFANRSGNCLSYALMFVAMAREVGLTAGFQEVDVPPDWTLGERSFVLNRHVNVFLQIGSGTRHVVDFNVSDFKTNYSMRRIDDGQALAHYYSNLGLDAMHRNDPGSALANFRRSVELGGRYAPAWIHTGLVYMRLHDLNRAEAAFLRALQDDPADPVAMSNLSDVYRKSGDAERAAFYRRKVAVHRSNNPYYRYLLAQQAYQAQRYDEAINHLEFAVEQRPNDHRLQFHLGLAQYRRGDLRAARSSMERAMEIAAEGSERQNYASKVEALLALENE